MSVNFGCSTIREIQLFLTVLSATFITFLHCNLSCLAVSPVVTSSFLTLVLLTSMSGQGLVSGKSLAWRPYKKVIKQEEVLATLWFRLCMDFVQISMRFLYWIGGYSFTYKPPLITDHFSQVTETGFEQLYIIL